MITKILGTIIIVMLLVASEFGGYRIIRFGLEWQEVSDVFIGLLMMFVPLLIVALVLGV